MIIIGLLNVLLGAMNIVLYTYSGAWYHLLAGVFCASCGTTTIIISK